MQKLLASSFDSEKRREKMTKREYNFQIIEEFMRGVLLLENIEDSLASQALGVMARKITKEVSPSSSIIRTVNVMNKIVTNSERNVLTMKSNPKKIFNMMVRVVNSLFTKEFIKQMDWSWEHLVKPFVDYDKEWSQIEKQVKTLTNSWDSKEIEAPENYFSLREEIDNLFSDELLEAERLSKFTSPVVQRYIGKMYEELRSLENEN